MRAVAPGAPPWLTDAHGCKIQDPSPLPRESATWTGECVAGWAAGDGPQQQHHTLFPEHTTVLNVCVKDDGTFESATQMISSADQKTDAIAMGVAQIQRRNPDPKTSQIDPCFTIGVRFLNEAISVMELNATD